MSSLSNLNFSSQMSHTDLLKEFTVKKKKTKPKREHVVPMKFMTFSFDKKK